MWNTWTLIIIGLVIVAVITIVIVLAVTLRKKDDTTPKSTSDDSVPPTSEMSGTTPVLNIAGKRFKYYDGIDMTWTGVNDELAVEPFVSLVDAVIKFASLAGAKAFVVYKGNVYYRPNIASIPTKWTNAQAGTDGSYIPV